VNENEFFHGIQLGCEANLWDTFTFGNSSLKTDPFSDSDLYHVGRHKNCRDGYL